MVKRKDVSFPETRQTWIHEQLALGDEGRAAVVDHLLVVYHEPLIAYCRRNQGEDPDEPEDIVNGFFMSRLSHESFVRDWANSGLRLRRWLANGFFYYLKERRAQRQRTSAVQELPEAHPGAIAPPDRELARAMALQLVETALSTARSACVADGLEPHWRVFEAVHMQDLPFEEAARIAGAPVNMTYGMIRAPRRRLQAALHELLRRDGLTGADLEHEVRTLLGELE